MQELFITTRHCTKALSATRPTRTPTNGFRDACKILYLRDSRCLGSIRRFLMTSILTNTYFSGAGLMDIGLQAGGLTLQQSFEIDALCCDTMRWNFAHEVVQCDITKKLVQEEKECHVMVATYPCTKYSPIADIHGVRTGDDLFLHFFRHVAIRRPELYVVENVPGLKKFPVVMEAMTKLPDYYVHVACPVKTSIWLPQKRDRLIIIGSRRNFGWREPTSEKPVTLAEILEPEPAPHIPDYVGRRLAGKYRDRPIISDPERGTSHPLAWRITRKT